VVSGAEPARLRLGVVAYLNAAPLVHGLDADPAFELVRAVPARVADLLHGGEVDLGMIPSIEYAAGDYAIVPGLAIGSRGPVRSVSLFHRKPLASLRKVALDASSRTSVALLRVLMRQRFELDPEYVTQPPPVGPMLASADAALAIGDPALYFDDEVERLDLGAEWTAWTGLPFVWAFWAGRPGAAGADTVRRLQRALEEGRAAIPAIARSYAGGGPGRAAQNESYLRTNVAFDLGEAELAGLREFLRRAHGAGVLPRVPELRFA
jgi:chorismate dehydratase